MSLNAALSIADSGLWNIQQQISLLSQNVANASTPNYAVETLGQTDLTASGKPMGVRTGVATADINSALQASVFAQNAAASALQTTTGALSEIDDVMGTPGSGNDLASLVADLQDAFSALSADPSSPTEQQAVVQQASTLAASLNSLSDTYTTVRQNAENAIVSEVGTINSTLSAIGTLSGQIVSARQLGQSSADLQNQLSAQEQTLSGLIGVNFVAQSNGSVLVLTSGGLELPTSSASALSVSPANVGPSASYPSSIPGIMLGGVDVTDQLTGGALGANITLRDQTLPGYQAGLDEFSENLATRFSAQGLTLFTNGSGKVPSGSGTPVQASYVGFAAEIQVNPAVTADPALVQDGTNAVAGSASGASAFTPNPASGPAGFTTLITRVLDYTFGADVQAGVAQPAINTTGLGPQGNLSLPFAAPDTPDAFAAALVGQEADDSANASSELSTTEATQSALADQLSSTSGVSIDQQMSQMVALQNSYGANARIIAAMQSMFQSLLAAVSSG
ncbi:MAG TPA: flagellar hook-associated protein FlgK [Acetobacteraceae bacterium]|nr:flagellar hook-associated protein FlgK [Acetobacteraceae bacterium]